MDCINCTANVDRWNIDRYCYVLCGRCSMAMANLVLMLEKLFTMTINNKADYVHAYNEWSAMGKPENVALIASQSVIRGTERAVTEWDPTQKWDRKKYPITWEDYYG